MRSDEAFCPSRWSDHANTSIPTATYFEKYVNDSEADKCDNGVGQALLRLHDEDQLTPLLPMLSKMFHDGFHSTHR